MKIFHLVIEQNTSHYKKPQRVAQYTAFEVQETSMFLCTVNPTESYTIALIGSLVHLHATDQRYRTELEYSVGHCSSLKVARSDTYYQICLSLFVRGFSFILDISCQLPSLKFSMLYLASNYFESLNQNDSTFKNVYLSRKTFFFHEEE